MIAAASSEGALVRPTIPGRYLAEMLVHTGLEPETMVALAGLPRVALRSKRFRSTIPQLERLYDLARDACGDEWFGYLRSKAPRGSYAFAMRMAVGSRDMGAFFESANRFYALFDGGHRYWSVTRRGSRATLAVHCRTAVQVRSLFFVHAMLLTPWRSASWLVGTPIPLRSVRMDPRFSAFQRETSFLFGQPLTQARGVAEISFDAAWLEAPLVRTPENVDRHVKSSLRTMLMAPAGDSLEARIRALLSASLPIASLEIVGVARELGMSRATLARGLAKGGTSFQAIKDELRRDHAIALLTGSRLPTAAVAERLGFSEVSSFARAFKAWTGMGPGRYRIPGRRSEPVR